MKVMFIENREKTRFWERIAGELGRRGVSTTWLVQNPLFSPDLQVASQGTVYKLPFPKSGRDASLTEEEVAASFPLLIRDRGRLYFESGSAHYAKYEVEIESALRLEQPDLVIGEATLFHELITVQACKKLGIAFIQPASSRYPRGRFSLFSHDTQQPALISNDSWPEVDAIDLAERIATSREVPFYMRKPGRLEAMTKKAHWAATRSRVFASRLLGETYNTPSIARKWELQRNVKQMVTRWNELARMPSEPARTILYPMQLQPEANIDVWGLPYSDQLALVQSLLAAAPSNVFLAIKANPKAKYELSQEFLQYAADQPRIILLPMNCTMADAQRFTIGGVTVSGTAGLEAVCGKGRTLSLRHPILEEAEFKNFFADSPSSAVHLLLESDSAGRGNTRTGSRLIQKMVSQSFPGLVADPFSYPSAIDRDNIVAVTAPIYRLLEATVATKVET